MSTIEEQFDRLTAQRDDPSEILNLIGQTEDLHLECKTIDEQEIGSNQIASKHSIAYFNYGKCVSAFANAEGGIVVWGLFAKERKKTEPDLIQTQRPIKKVTKVKTDFDSITGKVVSRRVVGIENRIVYSNEANDIGFIVTYVPMSDEAPHRVEGETSGSGKYYRRHGTGSYPMEHYELEEMFGRRANPKLRLLLTIRPQAYIQGRYTEYRLRFGLRNVGRGIAKFPFVEVLKHIDLNRDPFGIDANKGTGLPLITGAPMKYQGGTDHVIHIGDDLWIDQFIQDGLPLLTIKVACDGFHMKTFDINSNMIDYMRHLYNRIFEYEPGENNCVNLP